MPSFNRRPLLIVLTALLLLAVGSYLQPRINAGRLTLKSFTIISYTDTPTPSVKPTTVDTIRLASSTPVPSDTSGSSVTSPADTAIVQPKPSSAPITTRRLAIEDFSNGGVNGLSGFFAAISTGAHKSGKVRIGWFGDSSIEGDMVTQDLRLRMQEKYGGSGVGWVPITSPTASNRASLSTAYSKNWSSGNLLKTAAGGGKVGFTGTVFFPVVRDTAKPDSNQWDNASTVTFTGSRYLTAYKTFPGAALIYSNSGRASVRWTINDGALQFAQLAKDNVVTILPLTGDSPIAKLNVTVVADSGLAIYGATLEDGVGVYVDNFSVRGHSGLSIPMIPLGHLTRIRTLLNYRLIVLQFGANVFSDEMDDYWWYGAGMVKAIQYLEQAFPESSFLLVSTGDRAMHKDGRMVPAPAIVNLVQVQRWAARKTGIAFYDLYSAMGGDSSMVRWVESDPPLAAKDYIHFSPNGARKVAGMLFAAIMQQQNTVIVNDSTSATR